MKVVAIEEDADFQAPMIASNDKKTKILQMRYPTTYNQPGMRERLMLIPRATPTGKLLRGTHDCMPSHASLHVVVLKRKS